MPVKTIGLMMIFLSCAALGAAASRRLSRRVEELETLVSAVEYIKMEIRYDALPVGELFGRMDRIAEYRPLGLFGVCAGLLGGGSSLPSAWEAALERSKDRLSLEDDDYEPLRIFGRALGASDVEGQTALCDGCIGMLRSRLQEARAGRERRGRLYASLGVLTGAFAVALLI